MTEFAWIRHPTRWGPLRRTVDRVVSWIRPEVLSTDLGFELRVPRSDRSPYVRHLWLYRRYEAEVTSLADSILGPGDLAIDVGANVGYHTCLFARCVGAAGVIHAFEPEPSNRAILSDNLARNGFSWATVHAEALSDRSRRERFYLSDENRGDHSLVPEVDRPSFEVLTRSLDDFVSSVLTARAIRLLKIDVQGYEARVVEGMKSTLAAGRIAHVIVEFSPERMQRNGDSPAALLEAMSGAGMVGRILSSTTDGAITEVSGLRTRLEALASDPNAHFNLHYRLSQND